MKNTPFSSILAGIAIFALAAAVFVSLPHQAQAQGYYYGGGYGNSYYYPPANPYPYSYPPAPSSYNMPTYQYVYPNGYYQNYFVPTVRYFPPVYNPPVYHPPHYGYIPSPCSGYGYGGRHCY